MKHVGERIIGKTNRQLVEGKGTYVADVRMEGLLHVAILRSPYASALIRDINSKVAESREGVVAVFTGRELLEKMNPIFPAVDMATFGAKESNWYALAPNRTNYVGEPVAAVVAESRYLAREAADLLEVDYEELPVVSDPEEAMKPDSPRVVPEWDNNLLTTREFRSGDVERAFQQAEGVFSGSLRQHRYTGTPMEPRAYAADYDSREDTLTVWSSTQNPHPLRVMLSETLGLEEQRIRVIQPKVGGGFGLKVPTFQEEALIAYLALELKRPVRWVAERTEDFLAGGHARETQLSYEVAFNNDGTVTGLRARVVADIGVPSSLCGWAMSFVTAFCIPTVYKIPNNEVKLFSVVTNKAPWNGYRGFGKEAATFMMDRIMDEVALKTGLDRAEVRMRNFIAPEDFPYGQASGAMMDSGNYPEVMQRSLNMIDYDGFPEIQRKARAEGRHIGIGVGFELTPEGCAAPQSTLLGGYDGATVRVNPAGQVTVLTGVTSPGCGNETGIAQIVADELGVEIDSIKVLQGDTETCPYGLGNYSSRSVMIGGSAAHIAATEIRKKMQTVAANMLEVSKDDVDVEDGHFFVKGAPTRSVMFKEVASTVYRNCHGKDAIDVEPGLEATRYYQIDNIYHQPETQGRFSAYPTWPNCGVACIVEVDPETGRIEIKRYCAVHDSGKIINPLLADGQLHGGIAQGIGGAVFENLVYDEAGQLLTTSFMDYTCPTAVDLPRMEVEHHETPSPATLLGAKGVGESGVAAALGALCGAIENAFPDLDIHFTELPLTPDRVWRAIQEAQS